MLRGSRIFGASRRASPASWAGRQALQLRGLAAAAARAAALEEAPVAVKLAAQGDSKTLWDEHGRQAIWPLDGVRVNGITLRDGHQSLTAGRHHIEHLERAAKLIADVRDPKMKFPGAEEIGGGTTVDFAIRYRAEHPFRNMERLSRAMPHMPTMCLIRSDSLCTYSVQPRDVVHEFIRLYAKAGLDVFRNFDAYNNLENHMTVARAVHATGKHYQAAIVFTRLEDPTVFNTKWVANFAKDLVEKAKAHSICIKDMAGVSSPAALAAWVRAIKEAVPDTPVVCHVHFTTGLADIGYVAAVEAGANGIDCGLSTISGRTGHPAMESLALVLEERLRAAQAGATDDELATVDWSKMDPQLDAHAMQKAADYYRDVVFPLYVQFESKQAGSVDWRVYDRMIPGGMFTIFVQNLTAAGKLGLMGTVLESLPPVRAAAGGVALVTPTSDNVGRQAFSNVEFGEYNELHEGYEEMLRGALGTPKEPMREDLCRKALETNAKRKFTKSIKPRLDKLRADLEAALFGAGKDARLTQAELLAAVGAIALPEHFVEALDRSVVPSPAVSGLYPVTQCVDILVDTLKNTLIGSVDFGAVVASTWQLSLTMRLRNRIGELDARVGELRALSAAELRQMNETLAKPVAYQVDDEAFVAAAKLQGREIDESHPAPKVTRHRPASVYGATVDEVIAALESERAAKQSELAAAEKSKTVPQLSDDEYVALLRGEPSAATADWLLAQNADGVGHMLQTSLITRDAALQIFQWSSMITCAPSLLLAPGMARAVAKLEQHASERGFETPQPGTEAMAEYAVLQSMFGDLHGEQNILTPFFESWRPYRMDKDWDSPHFNKAANPDAPYGPVPGTALPKRFPVDEPEPVAYPYATKSALDDTASPGVFRMHRDQVFNLTVKQLDNLERFTVRRRRFAAFAEHAKLSPVAKARIASQTNAMDKLIAAERLNAEGRIRLAVSKLHPSGKRYDADQSVAAAMDTFSDLLRMHRGPQLEKVVKSLQGSPYERVPAAVEWLEVNHDFVVPGDAVLSETASRHA